MLVQFSSLGLRFALAGEVARVLGPDGSVRLQMAATDALARPTEILTAEAIDHMSPQEQMQRLVNFSQLPCCRAFALNS